MNQLAGPSGRGGGRGGRGQGIVCIKAVNPCYHRMYKLVTELCSERGMSAGPADAVGMATANASSFVVSKF